MISNDKSQTFLFLLALHRLELDENLGRGDEIIPGLFITNDSATISEFLTIDLLQAIGGLEFFSLQTAKAVVYFVGHGPVVEDSDAAIEVLSTLLHEVGVFLTGLWLVKDNAANFETGFMKISQQGEAPSFHSNSIAQNVSNALGTRMLVKFSREELRVARRLTREVLAPLVTPIHLPHAGRSIFKAPKLSNQKGVPRLSRAAYFLSGARMMSDLGLKLVDYATTLEVLFSTDSSELTHKIAHRIAMFVGKTVEERSSIFLKIKKAYSVRSKVVHGDVLGAETVKEIATIAEATDDILRGIFHKIFSSPELLNQFKASRDDMDRYFLEASFRP